MKLWELLIPVVIVLVAVAYIAWWHFLAKYW